MVEVPEFSVVIAAFNRESLIERSVRSVLNGEFQDLELVVVDDGSTDGTAAVLARISDERLRVVHQRNEGRTAARNNGAAVAQGRYLTFLDSDDYAEPDWLATMHAIFQRSSDLGVACCGLRSTVLDERRSVLRTSTVVPGDLGPVYYNKTARFAPPGTFAMKRELFEEIGGYDHELAHAENTELAHRLLAQVVERGLTVGSTPKVLINYEQCRPTASRSDYQARLFGAQTILERHGERYRLHGRVKRSNYFAIAGTSSAYLGDMAIARQFFLRAIRDAPTRPRNYLRLAAACIPAVAHRVWTLNDAPPNDL